MAGMEKSFHHLRGCNKQKRTTTKMIYHKLRQFSLITDRVLQTRLIYKRSVTRGPFSLMTDKTEIQEVHPPKSGMNLNHHRNETYCIEINSYLLSRESILTRQSTQEGGAKHKF